MAMYTAVEVEAKSAAVEGKPRPELAHARAMRADFADVVAELRRLLGTALVAYLGSVKDPRAVAQWAAGDRSPPAATQARLRLALQLALMIAAVDGAGVAQAWLQGMNPLLDDDSPARRLREEPLPEVGPQLVGAARSFLASG
jgi:hypothetical protein